MTQTQMGVAFALVLITGMGWYSKISDQQRQVKRYQQEVAEAADFEKRGLRREACTKRQEKITKRLWALRRRKPSTKR